jgi:sec-independent protein translocase protein TatA
MFRNPVTDLIIVVVVALLVFGPKRLPMLGRSLGQGLREFKEGITGDKHAEEERPALTPAAAAADPTPPPAPAATSATPSAGAPAEPRSAEAGSAEPRA